MTVLRMTSPTASLPSPTTVGPEDGGGGNAIPAVLGVPDLDAARLLLPLQWSEFCYSCERSCTFATFEICAEGLAVECTGCGAARIAQFSRMNSEGE